MGVEVKYESKLVLSEQHSVKTYPPFTCKWVQSKTRPYAKYVYVHMATVRVMYISEMILKNTDCI